MINEKLFYDIERTELTQIDPDSIYVGFFASRNARITVTAGICSQKFRPDPSAW